MITSKRGDISHVRLVERTDVNRNWTWTALDANGLQYREIEYRSIANLPRGIAIVRMVANVTGMDVAVSPEFGVMLPQGAKPIAYSVHALTGDARHANDVLTVIGYVADDGRSTLLNITERGDALVTDRSLSEFA